MSVVKFKLDRKGIQALVSSDEAQSVVTEAAEELRARAGDGFKVHSSNRGKRARAYVNAGTREAGMEQIKHHTLERVLGSVGGGDG
nr:MAG TPA: type I neck protein [Caudoviricetes sp.]